MKTPPPPGDPAPGAGTWSISNLQLLAKQVVEGLATGLHRSPHKGASVSFKQHRPYVPGDELRRLDWRAFARSDRYYIREYEQETNLRATLLVDLSGSMLYRGTSATLSKADFARQVASCLASLLLQQQDAAGLITFDNKIRSLLPSRSRPSHLHLLNEALEKEVPGGETNISSVFEKVGPRLERRGLVVLISDCFDNPQTLLKALAQLRHQQHEVLVFQVWDRDELEFPFESWTRFESLEIEGESQVSDPSALRDTYLDNVARFRTELAAGCARERIDLVPLITDQPCSDALAAYLKRRRQRR